MSKVTKKKNQKPLEDPQGPSRTGGGPGPRRLWGVRVPQLEGQEILVPEEHLHIQSSRSAGEQRQVAGAHDETGVQVQVVYQQKNHMRRPEWRNTVTPMT